jgi:hypothetical protein
MKEILLAKSYLKEGYSLPRPDYEEPILSNFYLCHDNDMKVCEGDLPFEPLPEIEEKGFWRSAVNFFKNPFKDIIGIFKIVIDIFKFVIFLIKTFVKLITTLFT